MILLLNIVYSLAAVSLLLLLGQFAVRLLSFGRHEQNPVYRLFRVLTGPVVRLTRAITPAKVADEHVPVVAGLLMFWICAALAVYLPRLAGAAS
jgi:uncharacterized protein YggT (Ycf19 family)